MAEYDGPGAIVRLWSANPDGTLRIYLDGSATPAIEARMPEFLAGSVPGFPPPLGGVAARGYNLYFPIPFARSCKVTQEGAGIYYTVAVRQYAPGTQVKTFRRDDMPEPVVRTAAERISTPGLAKPIQPSGATAKTQRFRVALAPGARATLADLHGPQAITELRARFAPEISEAALRGLVLRGTFDGEQTIEVPLGDFFGTAPGLSPFSTLPLGITPQHEAWSHWVMPMRRAGRLEVVNRGRASVVFSGEFSTSPYTWSADSMYFWAGYRPRYGLSTRPMRDMQVLEATGEGVFAGLSMAIDNPSRQWWGEGDEKIYVDGEAFPSWFGTGTEDYFGYAWSDVSRFEHAYHSQPRVDGTDSSGRGRGHWGRISNNRFHIADRIPFRKSLKFDLEMWHWAHTTVNVATVAYWYAKPGSNAAFTPLRPADLEVHPMPEFVPGTIPGAIEGEAMRIVSNNAKSGKAEVQSWGDLSGDAQLWWQGAAPGESLTLAFDAPRAGRFRVFGRFLQARDYGIHQLAINGQSAGEPRDFYAKDITPSEEIELGTFDLKATGNTFTATSAGKNPKAEAGAMLGLDYLRLQAVP
jgi:hypothetical protein